MMYVEFFFCHREQNEYCAKLLAEDTPEIAALVAGQRRKDDGSRYFVGGVDISFIKGNNEDACACLSVLRMPDLKVLFECCIPEQANHNAGDIHVLIQNFFFC